MQIDFFRNFQEENDMVAKILMYLKIILGIMSDASNMNRKVNFKLTECTSNYYFPSLITNNRSNTASCLLCAALTVVDKGISFSYNSESKTCLSYSKTIWPNTTEDRVFSPGMKMYDQAENQGPVSCADVHCSGVYAFTSPSCGVTKAFCYVGEDGPWMVIQRRIDGTENFTRTWMEFKQGFGDNDGEFWLGNEAIHCLTANGDWELRIDIESTDGKTYFAKYNSFSLGNEGNNYELSVSGNSGTAGDSLTYSHGVPFSTYDRDNDNAIIECAGIFGAWWYKQAPPEECGESNLNGKFGNIMWEAISTNSQKAVMMNIRKRL